MGRGRGLTGTPFLGAAAVAHRLVAQLSTSPVAALSLAGGLRSRAPRSVRAGSTWPHGLDDARRALLNTLTSHGRTPDDAVESAPPRVHRATPAHIKPLGQQRSAPPENPQRSVRRDVATMRRLTRSADARNTGAIPEPSHAAVRNIGRVTAGLRGASSGPGATVLGKGLGAITSMTAPAGAFPTGLSPHFRSTGPLGILPRGVGHAGSATGAYDQFSSAELQQLARGSQAQGTRRALGGRPSESAASHPAPATTRDRSSLPEAGARSVAAEPMTTASRSLAPLRPTPAVGPKAAHTAMAKPVRGLAALAQHFTADADNSGAGQTATTAATPAATDARTWPAVQRETEPDQERRNQPSIRNNQPTADPLAEADMAMRLADLVRDALADEARRSGIEVGGADL